MNLMMMRSAKTLATALLLAMISSTPALAQNAGMQNPEARIKELIEVLDISAEQEPAFREAMARVNAQQRESMRTMRQGQRQEQSQGQGQRQGQGREMMRARMAELQKITEEALTPVLSTEQMAKFREHQAAQTQRQMRQMRQGQQGGQQGQ